MAGPGPGGADSALNVSTATVIKTGSGWAFVVTVTVAGSTVGALYDNDSTSGNTAANQIGVVPEAVGSYTFYGFPFKTGLVYEPGTSQVASISFT